jgi:magnesium-transporting ATPase (P-type)
METATSIAQELGIYDSTSKALSHVQVENMDEISLSAELKDVTVFYRMSPIHKVKIVNAYKRRGEIVAMTGYLFNLKTNSVIDISAFQVDLTNMHSIFFH